jgi:peroxiredoxin Q/BCP
MAKKAVKKSVQKTTKKTAKKVVKKATKKAVQVTSKKTSAKTSKKTAPKLAKQPAKKSATQKAAAPAKVRVAGSSKVHVGQMVPSFTVPATSGTDFDLQKFKGQNVVLYFYPKDATPGCTLQGHEFTKLLPEFKKAGTEVFGISRDSIKSHEKFKAKECYTFDLLSDEDEALCSLFGVMKEKNMYGKKVWGVERSTFLIDGDGKLVAEWRGVKAEGNAQEVLSKVQSLSAT